jgi:hypothetical protein
MKNRLADPSEICALDFKHEFGRSAACSVSATIGIDRSILADSARTTGWTGSRKKTVSPSSDDQLDENLAIGYLTACFCPLPPHINRRPIWNFASQASGRLHEIEQAFGKDQAQGPPDM